MTALLPQSNRLSTYIILVIIVSQNILDETLRAEANSLRSFNGHRHRSLKKQFKMFLIIFKVSGKILKPFISDKKKKKLECTVSVQKVNSNKTIFSVRNI